MLVDHLINERGETIVQMGDHVQTDDVRFVVGSINDSQQLRFIDTGKPRDCLILRHRWWLAFEAVVMVCLQAN